MKKIQNLLKVLIIVMFVSMAYTAEAQGPGGYPPPPPGGNTGNTNNQGNSIGGNAPVGGGLFILLGLGAAYGGRKVYKLAKEEEK